MNLCLDNAVRVDV